MANKKSNTTTNNKETKNKTNATSVKKNTNNTSVNKKTTTKKSTNKKMPVKEIKKSNNKTEKSVEKKVSNVISKQEIVEKEIIEEIKNIKVAKLEDAKYSTKKRDKSLLVIGVFISLLGIIALILTLIANRIVDREFINDFAIALMVAASIIIEGFGSFIIISEA